MGEEDSLKKMEREMAGRFEIKTKLIGLGNGFDEEGRILNRIIRVTNEGWEYEADQRHAEIVIEALGLNTAKTVTTPGENEKEWETEANKDLLDKEKASLYRSIAARLNYLASGRTDLMYSVKEVCRIMSCPTVGGWKMLKRIGRYLKGKPRVVWQYKWQGLEEELEVFTDSNWAGCRNTGKSTSGGAMRIGEHLIKAWSRTQQCVTMSSAEAELVAMVKASAEAIGFTVNG